MKAKPTLNLRDALIATVMTAVVVTPIFGLHLERAGTRTIINPDWTVVAWACALVFLVQLLRPLIAAKMPKVSLPSLPHARPSHRNGLILRSEEHTSELQSPCNLVCRLLLDKTKQ